ncbi:uncharacterized protein [Henckelia pumila]|uniref:uncharacterized protein isoform X3 n=1 Tax=Henckelia pumila TaxID=405737 RepID=UPI003C6E0326
MDVEQMLDVGDERIEASVLEDIGTCEADLSGEPYEGCRGNRDVQSPGKRRGGCTSMLIVKRENVGRWVVRKFVRDHNHPLVVSSPKKRPTFDEKDKKIQDLTAELRLKKRLSAAYREQLLILIKDVENHNDNLTAKLQTIHSKLKEIEAKRHELSNH